MVSRIKRAGKMRVNVHIFLAGESFGVRRINASSLNG
jgi:hypothetical protein